LDLVVASFYVGALRQPGSAFFSNSPFNKLVSIPSFSFSQAAESRARTINYPSLFPQEIELPRLPFPTMKGPPPFFFSPSLLIDSLSSLTEFSRIGLAVTSCFLFPRPGNLLMTLLSCFQREDPDGEFRWVWSHCRLDPDVFLFFGPSRQCHFWRPPLPAETRLKVLLSPFPSFDFSPLAFEEAPWYSLPTIRLFSFLPKTCQRADAPPPLPLFFCRDCCCCCPTRPPATFPPPGSIAEAVRTVLTPFFFPSRNAVEPSSWCRVEAEPFLLPRKKKRVDGAG